uniref:Biopterin-dependent aromatic amino acid hydroxylase family profile domain-containing protein n=1 Tax=Romanomermis culicivorax TaxID=13658 RepID=A0A915HK83_ROMCU
MPLFADPDFAQFSQEIGLASLGANEEDIRKLATPVRKCGNETHAITDSPELIPFDPDRVVKQECLITTYQSAYFYTENFEEVQQKIRLFTSNMKRRFVVRYNPYTESVEVLNNKRALTLAVNTLRSDLTIVGEFVRELSIGLCAAAVLCVHSRFRVCFVAWLS